MKQSILLIILAILFIFLSPIIASADVIYLNDESEINGDIIEVTNETITIKNDDDELVIDIANIIKIIFEDKKEQNAEYSQLRNNIKAELEKLSIENTNITVEVRIIKDDFVNASYDEYDMDNENHRLDGINLKDYYNVEKKPYYMDITNYYDEENKSIYNKIDGEIIDVDKNKIRIRTFSGIVTKDIRIVYKITLNYFNENMPGEVGRKTLTSMIDYYNSEYWKFKKEESLFFQIVSYTNKELYKINGFRSFDMCLGFSPNFFSNNDDELSSGIFIELLYTAFASRGEIAPFLSIGYYIGVYFNTPHISWGYGGFWKSSSNYYKSFDFVMVTEGNAGIGFGNGTFYLFIDAVFGASTNGKDFCLIAGIGGGFNLMFTKFFGIRFLANVKVGIGINGFGFDVGFVFRFES